MSSAETGGRADRRKAEHQRVPDLSLRQESAPETGQLRALFHRLILPILFAIALAGGIETAIQLKFHPGFWMKTTWMMYDPYRGETFDRTEVYQRLGHFQDFDPEILSVGDSSGFFSLQSRIVNRYTDGHKFLSLNTGANEAFAGYKGIAEYMLRRSPHLRYVVLYVYPELLPSDAVLKVADLGPILYDDLVGSDAALTPPSAFLSPYAKFEAFDGQRYKRGGPVGNSVPVVQLYQTLDQAMGWLPEFDVRFDRLDGRLPWYPDQSSALSSYVGLTSHSMIEQVLGDFDNMVRSYGAKLVIAFAPVPARITKIGDPYIPQTEAALVEFQRRHPDVKFLFPMITRFGPEKFGMFNHLSREYSFLSSERLGVALHRLLTAPDSIPPFTASFKDPGSYPAVEARPYGLPDTNLLRGAMALFDYATTGNVSSYQLISRRVLSELGRDSGFKYMMEDTTQRSGSQSLQQIEFGYDLSEMRAMRVAVKGLPFCDTRPDLQWVQLDGVMRFTYKVRGEEKAVEPVNWPESSHIFIPLVPEDGLWKFDGYCPEPSLANNAE